MSLFACLHTDKTVQINDKFRLDVSSSWANPSFPDGISKIEVQPEASSAFFDVTTDEFLDWQFETIGEKTVVVRLTAGPVGSETVVDKSFTVLVLDVDEEIFLSDDDCLKAYEPDIHLLLPCYRCSFKYVHRKVTLEIVDYLKRLGIEKTYDFLDVKNPGSLSEVEFIQAAQLSNNPQIKEWATYLALELIHISAINTTDDIFDKKARHYQNLRDKAQSAGMIYIDRDGDGVIESHEAVSWSKNICLR